MIRRPKPGDDEEDILRMQEEFLKEKSKNQSLQPSAQVVNLRRTEHQTTKRSKETPSGLRKPSKYAQSKGLTNHSEKRPRVEDTGASVLGDILEKNVSDSTPHKASEYDDDKVYYPKPIPSVLGDIQEKNIDVPVDLNFKPMPSQGFPIVTKRDPTIKPSKKSIHTQCIQKEKQNNIEQMETDLSSSSSTFINQGLNLPNHSYIITNQDADSIHSENVNILNKMSEKEILEEKEKIMASLDPQIIEFIRKKRNKEPINDNKMSDKPRLEVKEETMECIETTESRVDNDSLWENDVLSHPHVDRWLHFESLEKDKLEWIKGMEENKLKTDEPYEARFDFKGYLLPYTIEYTEKTKTLFHHGEEPHRPGYSLTELLELSRSTITQQRVVSLNTLAGILQYYNAGIYKNIIELPLSKLFFVIRIAMDENKVIILEPALKAMRNLLFNRIDEASLDALIGFREGTYQPCLEHDRSEIEEIESKESELKDFHLAEIDIIAAVLRTEILQRVYYILKHIKPSFNCVQYSLQILTRLARDSVDTARKIVNMDHLMDAIFKYFVPRTSINFMFDPSIVYNGKPILAALKLLRVISLTSRDVGERLLSKYDVFSIMSEYVSSGVDGTYGLKVQIEAYCILSNLLQFKLGLENAVSLCPIIITTLYKHVQGTSIYMNSSILSASHAAVVLQFIDGLIRCGVNLEYKAQIYPLLKEGMQKWLSQMSHFDNYTCGHLRLVCSILNCFETVIINENISIQILNETLLKLSKSQGFNMIMNNLITSSNLLSGIDDKDLHLTKNLTSLGSSVIDSQQKVLPILYVASPIPCLSSLFKLLVVLNDKQISLSFLEQTLPYLRKLAEKAPTLINNWFTRMESDFVFSLVNLAIQSDIPESLKDLVYAVASKLCYILRTDKRFELEFLFNNIIFNDKWFTAERLFNLVSLSEADGFSKALTNIQDIKLCYSKVCNINYVDAGPFVAFKKWQEPILPRDWIYLPILSLYSKSQEKPDPSVVGEHAKKVAQKIATEKETIIRSSLEWIVFNELCFPDLLNDIGLTDRFCRLMCVFLCDNSLFLDAKIKILLTKCTQILFKNGTKFDFDKELMGLNNFQDFYTQLLEQFQSVSYGDHTFAACVLVPLAQRHNVKWRKLLWSEYAGCLRALDCPDDMLCYVLDAYIYPEESDESVVKSYFRALSSSLLRPGTIAYKIAHHHVECYKKRKVDDK
ncbi:RNA polymerase II-associated protein 1 [Zerene cesonia]|uniref:RNA polymerase II-associated protein 1 n=1 Tax=Zerene cesonia TaxID=33412 RepID=UPI0018E5060D|nr:RNA polymerase II-associated protein 1 [Zerene cesonia]